MRYNFFISFYKTKVHSAADVRCGPHPTQKSFETHRQATIIRLGLCAMWYLGHRFSCWSQRCRPGWVRGMNIRRRLSAEWSRWPEFRLPVRETGRCLGSETWTSTTQQPQAKYTSACTVYVESSLVLCAGIQLLCGMSERRVCRV